MTKKEVELLYDPNRKISSGAKGLIIWGQKKWPMQILKFPCSSIIERFRSDKGWLSYFKHVKYVDDDYLVIDMQHNTVNVILGVFLLSVSILLTVMYQSDILESFLLPSPLYILSLYMFMLAGRSSSKLLIIFDRVRGLVQLPQVAWFPVRLFHFSELKVKAFDNNPAMLGTYSSHSALESLFLGLGGVLLPIFSRDIVSQWSFYVWYMDRNRPLPFGTAFDKYRDRDYERRKLAGFLPPLFPSDITIAEHFDDNYNDLMITNKYAKNSDRTLDSIYLEIAEQYGCVYDTNINHDASFLESVFDIDGNFKGDDFIHDTIDEN